MQSNRTHRPERLQAGHTTPETEASRPDRAATGATPRISAAERRSGGAEEQLPVPAGVQHRLTHLTRFPWYRSAIVQNNGATVKLGGVGVCYGSLSASRMKKNNSGKRGTADAGQHQTPPEKVGWIRKFCGKGIFREIWKNRFVILKGDQLFISEKEVKEERRAEEVLDLSDYDRCEEIRKAKSRSKKNHSKFNLQRCSTPGNTVPNLLFLAVSPEEKESWINVLNIAITRSKNRILDEVTVEDSQLSHLTRDRVKIPHNRRLPTRGHLLAVASTSTSDGMLTLDLIQEEDGSSPPGLDARDGFRVDLNQSLSPLGPDSPRSKTDSTLSARAAAAPEASGRSQSLPRETAAGWEETPTGFVKTPQPAKRLTTAEKNRCASMDEILSHSETRATKNRTVATPRSPAAVPTSTTVPIGQLQELISQKLVKTEQLLTEVQGEAQGDGERGKGKGKESVEGTRVEAERLLREAVAAWDQAKEVLEEVKELRALYRQLDSPTGTPTSSPVTSSNSSKQNPHRKSLM